MGLLSAVLSTKQTESGTWTNSGYIGSVGRRPTAAGVRVDEYRAMTLGAVFACVRVIAEDVASLPTVLYRRVRVEAGEGKERATDDPLYRILRLEPNAEMGAYDFKQAMMVSALLWGNGYSEIERNGIGRVTGAYPIEPWRVSAKRRESGKLYYEVRNARGQTEAELRPENVLHVKGVTGNGLAGMMFATVGKEAIGLALAAHQFTSGFFANGAALSGVLSVKDAMKAQEFDDFVSRIRAQYEGSGKQHRMLALDHSADFKPLSSDPKNTQLVDTLHFAIEDIARYFRVTPHKIGHLLRATFNNIESLDLDHYKSTLRPRLVQLEEELTRKLISPENQGEMFIEHLVDAILRADFKTRTEGYASAINNGWLSRNEVRAKENMNPVAGGDTYLVQGAMAVVDDAGKPIMAADREPIESFADQTSVNRREQNKAHMMPVFAQTAERLVRREAKAMARQLTEAREAAFFSGHREAVADELRPACESLAKMCGVSIVHASAVADRYAQQHVAESLRMLEEASDRSAELERWTIERPAWIAEHLTNEVCDE